MYKFRCDLRGHTSDVRCILHYDEEVIISGSRDRTCRVWTSHNGVFESGLILCGHSDFIASLCILPACELYPDGLIVTGSNDHTICVYTPKCSEPQFILTSHSDTVCCVNPAISGTCGLLSSSWDSTVILWDLLTRTAVFKIPGNNNTPVWSVIQLEDGTIITASADKILRAYSNKGSYIKAFYGHTDCIRALYPVSKTHFVSCGNDGHVLRWSTENTSCDAAIDSVHHFLYSVFYCAKKDLTVYSGERGGIYINSPSGSDFIAVPCTSVWSVTVLPDGDIAAACSDGIIRLYTCNSQRYADDFKMSAYQSEVQKFATSEYQEKKKDMLFPYLNDLCGPEVLQSCGKISNEICFVRQGFLAIMYSWSTDRWLELAKRKGTYQYDITKKKMHNGKAYDFLFPINIDDSKPNLILPLTLGDDLLEKITQFISENNLSTHDGETIYNHIANTVKDDFIKASILESSMHGMSNDGSYFDMINKYFPKSSYVTFEKANIAQIIGKLKELSNKFSLEISEDHIETLQKLTSGNHCSQFEECSVLINLLTWPEELMLPVLDLLRLAIRNKSFHSHIFTSEDFRDKVKTSLISHLQNHSSPVNQLLVLKVCCNMFMFEPGRKAINSEFSSITSLLMALNFPPNFSPSFQVAASTLILNLTISTQNDTSLRIQCLKCITAHLRKYDDKEAHYRIFVAIGNLISYEGSFFIPKELIDSLKKIHSDNMVKGHAAHECLSQLLQCFQDDD